MPEPPSLLDLSLLNRQIFEIAIQLKTTTQRPFAVIKEYLDVGFVDLSESAIAKRVERLRHQGYAIPYFGARRESGDERQDIEIELGSADKWVSPKKKESVLDWRESFRVAQEAQKLYQNQTQAQTEAFKDFSQIDHPCLILPTGDWHLEDVETDLAQLEQLIETTLRTDYVYMILLGDTMSNWGASGYDGIMEYTLSPQASRHTAKDMLSDLDSKMKLLVATLGCHERHSFKAGIKEEDELFGGLKNCEVLPNGGLLTIHFSDEVEYKIFLAHKIKGSTLNPTYGLKKIARLQHDADIYLGGHDHTFATEVGELRGKDRYYTKINSVRSLDRHAAGMGFHANNSTATPCYLIWPGHKEICQLNHLQHGLMMLKAAG